LSNGLRVLYKYDKTLPIAGVCITFHVGSRNEAAGHTGATHILEHLLFKDSKKFNKANGKAITGYLDWFGAMVNATTSLDRTNYFEVMPREKLGEALALEADRMRGSLFNDADLASEMTVVRNEYERGRNNPYELLDEEVLATAFTLHPYRIPTIGTREDIEASTAAKLREFYDRFYYPNNATLCVFGDVSRAEAEKLVVKHFGKIPSSPQLIPVMDIVEPMQKSPRTCEIKKQAGVSIAQLSYKAPSALDPDFVPLYVLATILAGGFSSRMQKAIVDKGNAAEVSFFLHPTRDPYVLSFIGTCTEGIAPKKLVDLLRAQCAKLAKEGVTSAEVKRARERILSQIAQERDGIFNEMYALSESVAAGDWTLGYKMEERINKITSRDVKRVAQKYLVKTSETSGILVDTPAL